jgi:serine/threonine protein kinase
MDPASAPAPEPPPPPTAAAVPASPEIVLEPIANPTLTVESEATPKSSPQLPAEPASAPERFADSSRRTKKAVGQLLGPPHFPGDLGQLGPYRVIKLIGEGGMGLVFQAEDMYLQRPVALKVMRPDIARDHDAWRLFLKEAQATAALKSARIATIYQIGEEDGTTFMAMELLQGHSLENRLQRGPIPVSMAIWVVREAALGLSEAHAAGFFHRDIKPANIWLEQPKDATNRRIDPLQKFRPDGAAREEWRSEYSNVKILDFGLVRLDRDGRGHLRDGTVVGTPAYMSPEQARGQLGDARSDIFSLGVVLYRLVTGKLPFPGDTALELMTAMAEQPATPVTRYNSKLPEPLVELIHLMLQREPGDRPQSTAEVAERLKALDRVRVPDAEPEVVEASAPEAVEPAARRSRPLWPVAVAAGLALVLAAGAAFYFSGRSSHDDIPVVPPPAVTGDGLLSPADAYALIGENVRVEFAVKSAKHFSDGTILLYAPDELPQDGLFRAVINAELADNLVERGLIDVDSIAGQKVRVEGTIVREQRYTEIHVATMDQLSNLPKPRKVNRQAGGPKPAPKAKPKSPTLPREMAPEPSQRRPEDEIDIEEFMRNLPGFPKDMFENFMKGANGKNMKIPGAPPPPKR